jgi:myo-inositol-1(or 4)-monophosphatase
LNRARDGPASVAEPARLARALADAAHDAWQPVASRRDRHDVLRVGADGTPTTRADDRLDEAILATADELGVSVLSEESGFTDHGSHYVAVVDPLDGSRNAGRGLPFFCTSIAIGTRGQEGRLSDVVAGCVRDLTLGTRYEAVRGAATVDGSPVRPRRFDPDEILIAMIADYEDPATLDRLQRKGQHARDLGSAALELCYVGTGALDVFDVRRRWLRIIDIAAGTLFVRESGGLVLDPESGKDLDVPFDLAARTGIIAARNQAALEAVT